MSDFIFDRSKWAAGLFYDVTSGKACAIGQFALQDEKIATSLKTVMETSDAGEAESAWGAWLDSINGPAENPVCPIHGDSPLCSHDDPMTWLEYVYDASDTQDETRLVKLFAEKDINIIFVNEYPSDAYEKSYEEIHFG